jgi:ribosomal-protein-alanine N-acetyltransferase
MKIDVEMIEIRNLCEADLDAVLGIAEILEQAPQWPRSLYEEALKPDSPRPRVALVACDTLTGEAAGFAIAALVSPEAELETIAVAGYAQRRGIGRRLLSALVTELSHAGIEKLLLEVRASNRAAIRFYESANFKQIGTRVRYYADPEEDAVLMSLQLG